jgi:uncharacterized protein YyaL (SSP411 family)
VIIGPEGAPSTDAMLEVARQGFRPNKVLLQSEEGAATSVPLLQNRPMLDGRATAYVCSHGTCRQPVDTPEALAAQLP